MDDIPALVRASAEHVAAHATHVKLHEDAVRAFAASIDRAQLNELAQPLQWPLEFTVATRVNFECVRNLLNFGSGFRRVLQAHERPGAFDTICRGVLTLYITHHNITAQTMASLSLHDVAELFDLPLSREVPVPGSPIMTQFVDGPLKPLAVYLHRVLTDSGRLLLARGASDFFMLIAHELKPTAASPLDARRLASMLCSVLPAFADKTMYHGREVWVAKKVQLLAADLARSVGPMDPAWACATDGLTVFSDNVLPCVLRAVGILEIVDEEARATIDAGKVVPTGDVELELRLMAVAACERLLRALDGVSAPQLDLYLWRLGKEPAYRPLERHYCQNTVFY